MLNSKLKSRSYLTYYKSDIALIYIETEVVNQTTSVFYEIVENSGEIV